MNRIFYNFNLMFFSFFGIGFIPKFTEILTVLSALLLLFIIPDDWKAGITILLIIFFAGIYLLQINKFIENSKKTNIVVVHYALGIWTIMCNPLLILNIEWYPIGFLLYFFLNRLQIFRVSSNNGVVKYKLLLMKQIFAGITGMVIVTILSTGLNLYPLIKIYLNF